jgi:tetratricopeptide (TPR) repeat protein
MRQGAVFYRLKKYKEAANRLNDSLNIESKYSRANAYLGLTHIQNELLGKGKDFDTAFTYLNNAIEQDGKNLKNYRDLAEGYLLVYDFIKDYDYIKKAEYNLKEAIAISNREPSVYYLYSVLEKKRGYDKEAKEYMDKAYSLGYIDEPEIAPEPIEPEPIEPEETEFAKK